jgi:hypothetical protein
MGNEPALVVGTIAYVVYQGFFVVFNRKGCTPAQGSFSYANLCLLRVKRASPRSLR